MATPISYSVSSLLVLIIMCVVFSNCENATESNEFENVVTEVTFTESEADSIVEEKNSTTNDAVVAGIRDAFSLIGMEVSNRPEAGVAVSARVKMSSMFHPLMLVPGLIVWGFAPVMIANLKFFVMQALMLNHMALMSAWYMTLRNIVFGPRPGPIVKYSNYGYGHGHGPNRFNHYHHRH